MTLRYDPPASAGGPPAGLQRPRPRSPRSRTLLAGAVLTVLAPACSSTVDRQEFIDRAIKEGPSDRLTDDATWRTYLGCLWDRSAGEARELLGTFDQPDYRPGGRLGAAIQACKDDLLKGG